MTFASISVAFPLAAAIAFVLAWTLTKRGTDRSLATWWAFSMALWVGVAALLSSSPAGMMRGLWPREAVDWLGIAAGLLTCVAAMQTRPVAIGRLTLAVGALLGVLIACRLLYGSVYLRPGHTSINSLLAIAPAGAMIGVGWHLELARAPQRRITESLACMAASLGASATLGMSGSFQYATIGMLVTATSAAVWMATRSWPGVSNLVVLMLVGLGMAFAELNLLSLLGLTGAMLLCSLIGLRSTISHVTSSDQSALNQFNETKRMSVAGLIVVFGLVSVCVGLNAQRFLSSVKGNNASHGGYEAYK